MLAGEVGAEGRTDGSAEGGTASQVVCLAGRRIDPPDAEPGRFPASRIDAVGESIRRLLEEQRATALVCSAACGADLLALEAAAALGLELHVVLPFDRDRFRATSVTDRPGDWGDLYDRIIDLAQRADTLTIIDSADGENSAYAAVNVMILDVAAREAAARGAIALIVWDGRSRGESDMTAHFAAAARARGMEVVEVRTL